MKIKPFDPSQLLEVVKDFYYRNDLAFWISNFKSFNVEMPPIIFWQDADKKELGRWVLVYLPDSDRFYDIIHYTDAIIISRWMASVGIQTKKIKGECA